MEKCVVIVNSELGSICFVGGIHGATALEELYLSPRYFYKRWRDSSDVPTFPHHEVELFNIGNFKKRYRGLKLHIHRSVQAKGKKKFMCYTADVSTPEAAQLMFRAWCVGTVYSFIQGRKSKDPKEYDFAYPFMECNQDPKMLIEYMKTKYNITIKGW